MLTKLLNRPGIVVGILAMAGLGLMGVRAQQSKGNNYVLTTNWVGCLVIGNEDISDPIALGPHPTAQRQIEIGLRSDGVLIWRRASQ